MADIIDGLVAQSESHIGALQEGVGRKDVIVQLDDSSDNLGRGSDGVIQLVVFTVANGQPIQRERTSGVVDKETLQAGAVVSKLAHSVKKNKVENFLVNSVVTTVIVNGGVLFVRNQLLGVVQLAAGGSADLIDYSCRAVVAVPVVSDTAN